MPGLFIRERKQCQFLVSVESGDDPRRPTTEPSAARIEQNRAREVKGGRYGGAQVLCHFRKPCHASVYASTSQRAAPRHQIPHEPRNMRIDSVTGAHQELESVMWESSYTCLSPHPAPSNRL